MILLVISLLLIRPKFALLLFRFLLVVFRSFKTPI